MEVCSEAESQMERYLRKSEASDLDEWAAIGTAANADESIQKLLDKATAETAEAAEQEKAIRARPDGRGRDNAATNRPLLRQPGGTKL